MPVAALAFDRASVRTKDEFGRLHVSVTPISKACVNDYYGREIPGAAALGLEPNQRYALLRDPEELARAAPTANRMPVMGLHKAQTAAAPQQMIVVGSTGSDAVFEAPYLKNSLVVWVGDAIEDVESDDRRQLSCSYAYDPDMTPGDYQGTPYHGVMRNIRFNHVAIVEDGRAGPDVLVEDSLPKNCWSMLPAMDASFEEGDHPRAPDGKFGSGGSSSPKSKLPFVHTLVTEQGTPEKIAKHLESVPDDKLKQAKRHIDLHGDIVSNEHDRDVSVAISREIAKRQRKPPPTAQKESKKPDDGLVTMEEGSGWWKGEGLHKIPLPPPGIGKNAQQTKPVEQKTAPPPASATTVSKVPFVQKLVSEHKNTADLNKTLQSVPRAKLNTAISLLEKHGDPNNKHDKTIARLIQQELDDRAQRGATDAALVKNAVDEKLFEDALPPGMRTNHKERRTVKVSRKNILLRGAITAHVTPLLAQDQKMPDLRAVLLGTTAANWRAAKDVVAQKLEDALRGRLAADAKVDAKGFLDSIDKGGDEDPDESDEMEIMEDAEGETEEERAKREKEAKDKTAKDAEPDKLAKAFKYLDGKIDSKLLEGLKEMMDGEMTTEDEESDEEMAERKRKEKAAAEDAEAESEEMKAKREKEAKDKAARDARIAKDKAAKDKIAKDEEAEKMMKKMAGDHALAIDQAIKDERARQRDVIDAERFVSAWVGDIVLAQDSAEDVYRLALGKLGIDVRGVHASALKHVLTAQPKPGKAQPSRVIAMDSAAVSDFAKRFPNAARVRVMH